MKVAAATINTTPLDWAGNSAKILTAIADAKANGVSLLCLPEMCISGYGCEDMFLAPATWERAMDTLKDVVVPATNGICVCVGIPVQHLGSVYNCSAMIVDGKLLGFTAKQNLAGDGIHYEPRWFKPWPTGVQDVAHEGTPIGDIHYNIGGVKVGLEICEDAWVAGRPGALLAEMGCEIILNPSASHFAFGKIDVRERFVAEGSRAFGVGYVYANLVGNEAGRVVYDGGALIAQCGEIVALGERFQSEDVLLTTANLDVDLIRERRVASASRKTVFAGERFCINAAFPFPKVATGSVTGIKKAKWEATHRKEEEFARAVCLGLRDYMRKSRTKGFVVSLSGGADSAVVACIVAYLAKMYGLKTREILTTVYQGTKNSTNTTRDAARMVAEAIGATHHEVDVDAMVNNYVAASAKAQGRELDWKTDDLTLQNIQARARGPMAWMFANIEDKLLLATSNRSEAAVGYATMDGDTCGALSPISGVDKEFLLKWLVWARDFGPDGLGPVPALSAITSQQPTAELRPVTDGVKQTDEDDLMPYGILNRIEIAAIRDKKSPAVISAELIASGIPETKVTAWIAKFFRLWQRNQWKRERFAPGIHLDDENLDPRTWCRFPMLSGDMMK